MHPPRPISQFSTIKTDFIRKHILQKYSYSLCMCDNSKQVTRTRFRSRTTTRPFASSSGFGTEVTTLTPPSSFGARRPTTTTTRTTTTEQPEVDTPRKKATGSAEAAAGSNKNFWSVTPPTTTTATQKSYEGELFQLDILSKIRFYFFKLWQCLFFLNRLVNCTDYYTIIRSKSPTKSSTAIIRSPCHKPAIKYPTITYYWTVPIILDHSYLVEKLTSSKFGDTNVSGF